MYTNSTRYFRHFCQKISKKEPRLTPAKPCEKCKIVIFIIFDKFDRQARQRYNFLQQKRWGEKLHRCLAWLSNLLRGINFMSIWVAKGLLNKFDSHARQRCNFSVSNLAFPVLHKLLLWHRIYPIFSIFLEFLLKYLPMILIKVVSTSILDTFSKKFRKKSEKNFYVAVSRLRDIFPLNKS